MASARLLALAAAASLVALPSCSGDAGAPASVAAAVEAKPTSTPAPTAASVVAEVEGHSITLAELDERARPRLARVRQEEYDIRRQILEELIDERLVEGEAKKRGVTAEELRRTEIDAKVTPPAPGTADTIYSRNRNRFSGQPRDKAIARIQELLVERAKAERRQAFEREVREGKAVTVHLVPPRVVVEVPKGAPSTGADNARVTVVEFTDYQCPFCHRAQSTIEQVLQQYAGQVRLVHLDFPLDSHAGAVPAARAARCAGEQGRFWDYHRSLMTRSGSLDETDLRGRALDLKLDIGAFSKCFASERHDAAIRADMEQGMELGVSGTPAYFVNGRMISGARPFEDFAEAIDAELAL